MKLEITNVTASHIVFSDMVNLMIAAARKVTLDEITVRMNDINISYKSAIPVETVEEVLEDLEVPLTPSDADVFSANAATLNDLAVETFKPISAERAEEVKKEQEYQRKKLSQEIAMKLFKQEQRAKEKEAILKEIETKQNINE